MSTIQIISENKTGGYKESNWITFEAIVGKTQVEVTHYWYKGKFSSVNVTYKNAVSVAYRGTGKAFESIDKAIEAYKMPAIKQVLEAARIKI